MVYLVKTRHSNLVRAFYSENEMIAAGFKKADKTVTDEEFNSNGCYARLIEGNIVVGKTEDEKAQEELMEKEAELKARLDQIDKEAGCGRAFRTIAIETAKILHISNPNNAVFDPEESQDLKKIIAAEETAISVRAELAPVLAAKAKISVLTPA